MTPKCSLVYENINGVLLPGGGVDLVTSQYSRVAKIFMKYSKKAYDDGEYFPIWGTCLGFEQLLGYLR